LIKNIIARNEKSAESCDNAGDYLTDKNIKMETADANVKNGGVDDETENRVGQIFAGLSVNFVHGTVLKCPKFLQNQTDHKSQRERNNRSQNIIDMKNVIQQRQNGQIEDRRRAAGDDISDNQMFGQFFHDCVFSTSSKSPTYRFIYSSFDI